MFGLFTQHQRNRVLEDQINVATIIQPAASVCENEKEVEESSTRIISIAVCLVIILKCAVREVNDHLLLFVNNKKRY
jgi:hypothetical protein